jgi:hypothetical protein
MTVILGVDPGAIRHGETGYTYHQCRCPVCTAAKTAAARRQRARRPGQPLCACGCGEMPVQRAARFVAGHNARLLRPLTDRFWEKVDQGGPAPPAAEAKATTRCVTAGARTTRPGPPPSNYAAGSSHEPDGGGGRDRS